MPLKCKILFGDAFFRCVKQTTISILKNAGFEKAKGQEISEVKFIFLNLLKTTTK